MPVLHFGMTGMLQARSTSRIFSPLIDVEQIKGQPPIHYREAPRKVSTEWPPRFMKVTLPTLHHDIGMLTNSYCLVRAACPRRNYGHGHRNCLPRCSQAGTDSSRQISPYRAPDILTRLRPHSVYACRRRILEAIAQTKLSYQGAITRPIIQCGGW